MKAELWSNEETMGDGVRGEGSAVTVFFLSLLLLTTPPPAHQTPPRAFSRLNLVRGCLSNTQKKPPATNTIYFSNCSYEYWKYDLL